MKKKRINREMAGDTRLPRQGMFVETSPGVWRDLREHSKYHRWKQKLAAKRVIALARSSLDSLQNPTEDPKDVTTD